MSCGFQKLRDKVELVWMQAYGKQLAKLAFICV